MDNTVRGWKFPVEIDPQTGKFKTVENSEDIREAVKIILTTKKGERINRPGFGSNLFKYVFTSVNYTELKGIEYEIKQSLSRWEPRIKNLVVSADSNPKDNTKVVVNIQYELNEENVTPEEINLMFDVNQGFNFS